MLIDRRTVLSLAAAFGTSATFPELALAAPNVQLMRASLGSSVLSTGVAHFWAGMHPSLGYYLEEGVVAHWRGVQSQTQALGLLAAQSQEVGGVGPETLMGLAVKGKRVPLKVAFTHYQRNANRVIVKADSDIKSWRDLKGKKIGIVHLGQISTQWYSKAAAREVGLNPDKDISFVPAGTNATAGAALEKGQCDAYVSFLLHTAKIERLGFKVRYLPEPSFAGYNSFTGGMTVNSDFLKENRMALVGFFRAMAKGTLFAETNPRATIQIHYDLFPAALPKGKKYEDSIQDALYVFEKNQENMRVNQTEHKLYGMQSRKKWETVAYTYMKLDKKQIPDVGAFYTTELIEEANDFDKKAVIQQAKDFKLKS